MTSKNPNNQSHPGEDPPRFPPLLILLIGILCASTSSLFIRFAQQEAASIVIAMYRMVIATALLLPWTLLQQYKIFTRLSLREWLLSALAGIFLGAHFGTWISSLEYTSVTSSVVLVQTTPVFVMILSPLFLHEKPTYLGLIGLFMALVGSLAIAVSESCALPLDISCFDLTTNTNELALKGDLLAVAGAFTGALYLIIGRKVRSSMPLMPYITLVYGVAAVTLVIAVIIGEEPYRGFSTVTYGWFFLLAIIPQLFAHSSYNWSLRFLPASTVSLCLLGEPVAATILAYFILFESLPPIRWIGALIVLIGIVLSVLGRKKILQPAAEVDTIQP